MNKFEVVLIINPELATNSLEKEIDDFKTKLSSQSGNVISEENWGLEILAIVLISLKKHFTDFFKLKLLAQ